MILSILEPLLGPMINKIIDDIPDFKERDKVKANLKKELLATIGQINNTQVGIDKIESANKNIFISGWRPFIGWICASGLFWAFVLQPIFLWFSPGTHIPVVEEGVLYHLVVSMLGMSGLRTVEKMKVNAK